VNDSPAEGSPGARRPGVAALVLAAVAGFVDAYVYLRVTEVFIANQSGNLIVGGMSLAGADVGDVVLPFLAVLAYVAGAAAAAGAFHHPSRHPGRRLVHTVVAVLVVLAGAALTLTIAGEGHVAGPRTPLVALVVVATASAMGAQATAVRRAGGVSVLTTASTGAITQVGVELGRDRGRLDPAARRRAAKLIGIVVAYVGGAAVGGVLSVHTDVGAALLLVPCVALVALLAVERS
jgi:uncharacterized membrane protein YoaK (UPF0700 family)